MPRKYAIVGTGAIGGFYGAKLQHSGKEVHFLLNRDYEYVKQNGLVINSVDGDFFLPQINAYNDVTIMPVCDVVIVSLKTTHNSLLPKLLPSLVKENGIVLVLQNGLNIESHIANIVGDDRVMGGLCFICSNKVGAGYIRHLDYGAITLGDYDTNYNSCGITEPMKQIATDFQNAGITIHLTPDLLLARWQKLVWNIPFNGLSVILNSTTDKLIANIYSCKLVEEIMYEVVSAASECDRTISADFVQKMLYDTAKMKPYAPSMKLDYDAQRPLEIEAIFGNPLRMAQKANIPMPRIAMLYQQLKFLSNTISQDS